MILVTRVLRYVDSGKREIDWRCMCVCVYVCMYTMYTPKLELRLVDCRFRSGKGVGAALGGAGRQHCISGSAGARQVEA